MENTYSATGRRKTAIARVILKPGKGDKIVNGAPVADLLQSETLLSIIEQPFKLLDLIGSFDVIANVEGGGLTGQSGALRLGISRALAQISEDNRKKLRKGGFLTRDSRQVERQKYGQAGARKRYQFSKR